MSTAANGVFTDRPRRVTNDFFVNLLSMDTEWRPVRAGDEFAGIALPVIKWIGTRVDLVFGSNSVLRALGEVYASADGKTSSCTTSSRHGTRL